MVSMRFRRRVGGSPVTVSTKENAPHKSFQLLQQQDPVMRARSPENKLKRQGSIGVGNENNGIAIIRNDMTDESIVPLKESALSPTNNRLVPFKRQGSSGQGPLSSIGGGIISPTGGILKGTSVGKTGDDSSLESIGTFEYGGFKGATDSLGSGNMNAIQQQIQQQQQQQQQQQARKSVKWNSNVKGGKGCHGFNLRLQGLMDDLGEFTFRNVSKLDGGAQRLGKRLEGLGMKCAGGGKMVYTACDHACENSQAIASGGMQCANGVGRGCAGGGKMMFAACDQACANSQTGVGAGGIKCARCGINDGLGGGFIVLDDVDTDYLACQQPLNDREDSIMAMRMGGAGINREDSMAMRDAMFETRDAIKESRDAIMASRDAILGSFEEMKTTVRDSRNCMEDSRVAMNDCREAVHQSNNVAMRMQEQHQETQAYQAMTTVREMTVMERGVIPVGGKEMWTSAGRKQQYQHSSSQRESASNGETGMGNHALVPASQDPFSSSMHACQQSPRAVNINAYEEPLKSNTVIQTADKQATKPLSILKKKRSFGNGKGGQDRYAGAADAFNTRYPASRSPHANNSRSMLSRRNKDKNYRKMPSFSSKTTSKNSNTSASRNVSSNSNSNRNNNSTPTSPSSPSTPRSKTLPQNKKKIQDQRSIKKKKKNISRLVIGGIKKPLKNPVKFVSQGVKANLKNSRGGPKRILNITIPSYGRGSPRRGY